MKLSEYFIQQHSKKMPAHIKSDLFYRIQKEKNWIEVLTKMPSKILSFVSKRIMYTSLAAILVFVVFGWLLLDKSKVVDFGIFSVKENNTSNVVFADYVAEIVEFDGEYSLFREGKKVLNSDEIRIIQDWDIVSLSIWTDLIFNLQDWTKGKIVWPAEFSIIKTEKWYQISLFDGKFFRIYCPECTSDMEIVTPDFSISQEKSQNLDLHIAKEENGEMLVKNEWDKITVKTKKSEKEPEIKQVTSELIIINQNSEEIKTSNNEVMLNFMAKNNISATFTLSTEKVEWPEIKNANTNKLVAMQAEQESGQPIQGIKIEENQTLTSAEEDIAIIPEDKDLLLEGIKEIVSSENKETLTIDENIVLQLWLPTEDTKKVPSTTQMQTLKTNLNSFFLMNLFESVYKQDNVNQNISKFANHINSIASSFGYPDRASADLWSIKVTIQSLKSKLEKDRYVSPSYILQMEKITKWCDEIESPSKSDWESLKSDLPLNLRLM